VGLTDRFFLEFALTEPEWRGLPGLL
jgi:hypothetical protein